MTAAIPAEQYKLRRQKLASSCDAPVLAITASNYMQQSGTTSYPFYQDSNFLYLTGVSEPGWILFIDVLSGEEILIKPAHSATLDAFEGAADEEKVRASSGISTVVENREGWQLFLDSLRKNKKLATLDPPPSYSARLQLFTNPSRRQFRAKIRRRINGIEFEEINSQLRSMRSQKDEHELATIQDSINITATALQELKMHINHIAKENQAEAIITSSFRNQNAVHGYEPIVAAGANATTLHYTKNSEPINNNLLLIDVGAKKSHYTADISRTYVNRKPTQREMDVYQEVADIQDYATTLLKPGTYFKEYESKVEQRMGMGLKKLGLIDNLLSKNIRQYYPHATSHFLGLDVHDVGDYDSPLKPDMVLTVEPGIYIPEEGLGIRLEDDVVIEASGVRIMSKKIERKLQI